MLLVEALVRLLEVEVHENSSAHVVSCMKRSPKGASDESMEICFGSKQALIWLVVRAKGAVDLVEGLDEVKVDFDFACRGCCEDWRVLVDIIE
jgi:hypothetical protein